MIEQKLDSNVKIIHLFIRRARVHLCVCNYISRLRAIGGYKRFDCWVKGDIDTDSMTFNRRSRISSVRVFEFNGKSA